MRGRILLLLFCAVFLGGCESGLPPESAPPAPAGRPAPGAGSCFDPARTGTIEGTVRWDGPVPAVEPFRSSPKPLVGEGPHLPQGTWPNPHVPVVDPASGGVGNAVIFLRGVDTARARPWPYPPVEVEIVGYQFRVRQGTRTGQAGLVRRGDEVTITRRQEDFLSVQGRGAAFFAWPFPDADVPRRRPLDRPGLVELQSGSGQFWMRAYLFVDDHSYYTLPDEQGRFRLTEVPEGEVELVCWLPDWRLRSRELDADTGQTYRVTFEPAREYVRKVTVRPGASTRAEEFLFRGE